MIRLENLSKSFGLKSILDHESFHFSPGVRYALVGSNGAGKTTLLRIISGEDHADSGEVLIPGQCRLGYLPQEPNPSPRTTVLQECLTGAAQLESLQSAMENSLQELQTHHGDTALKKYEEAESRYRLAGGYALEARGQEILMGLGFSEEMVAGSPLSLSGGWRMRLELAKIFINLPDFLILDEPTNHLDLPSLAWVECFLMNYRGTLLFVSHDRALLNRLAQWTLHLHGGHLEAYAGGFDDFLEQRSQREEQARAQKEQLDRKIRDMEKFVERFGAKASKATQAQSRVKMIQRLRSLEQDINIDAPEDAIHFTLPEPPKCSRIPLEVNNLTIGYQRPLTRDMSFRMERGQKIAVIGANGIGKTTLLRTLCGLIPPIAGSFAWAPDAVWAYFTQDQLESLDGLQSALQNVVNQSPLSEGDARKLLGAFLFQGDDVHKPVGVLSGGEKSRVALAQFLTRGANILVLDEPTNHLDMASVEVLTDALADFKGTILYVSHDRSFIQSTATHILAVVPDGRSRLFEGNLDDYEHMAELAGFPNVLKFDPTAPSRAVPASSGTSLRDGPVDQVSEDKIREMKREKSKLERRLGELDISVARLQDKIQHIQADMAATAPDQYQQLDAMNLEMQDLQLKLDQDENEWLEVSTRLEQVTETLAGLGRG